jgi:demethylmenaquinone methyltransferase/2-methoxy-6-polyprenyl-1,4-benzoquinol methylase
VNRIYSQRELARESAFQTIWNEDIPDVFADVAKYYDRANFCATLGLIDWLRQRFISTMVIEPNYQVLDVCAGTNAIGIDLLKREPRLEVYAVDRSAAMQQVGRELAENQGFRIKSTICDVHQLPYPDNHFDIVTLQWATRHVRAVRVFSEVRRVLKPGGYFYHCDMLRPGNRLVEQLYYMYLKVCLKLVSRAFGSASAALRCRKYFVDAIRMFYVTEELTQLLSELRFSNVVGRSLLAGAVGFHKAQKRLT